MRQILKNGINQRKKNLNKDPLIKFLSETRNSIVHKKMFLPKSKASIGITELRGMKLGMGMTLDPLEDSEQAMSNYLNLINKRGDLLGILQEDEDSIPCIHREWYMEEFDIEIVELCSTAWLKVGETIIEVINWLGGQNIPQLSLNCRHTNQEVQFKLFDRNKLREQLENLNK